MILPVTVAGHVVAGPSHGRTLNGKHLVTVCIKDSATQIVWLAFCDSKPDRAAADAAVLGDAIVAHGRADDQKRTIDVRRLGDADEPFPAHMAGAAEGPLPLP
jgi:hypothetical protein